MFPCLIMVLATPSPRMSLSCLPIYVHFCADTICNPLSVVSPLPYCLSLCYSGGSHDVYAVYFTMAEDGVLRASELLVSAEESQESQD